MTLPADPATNTNPAIIYSGDEDRFRFVVEEARTGYILTRDLTVQNPKVMRVLSGPCSIEFDVDFRDSSNAGIYFKPWGHWIHAVKPVLGDSVVWASGLVQPSDVDKKTGVTHLTAQGFSGYAKKMPWLDNWNPLANDVFEVPIKIWNSLQAYPGGNLGVTVYPAVSGLEMLPGYAFDGNLLNLDFFSQFIRATDKVDSAEYMDKLARDVPFDYVEQSEWNEDRTAIIKKIFLAYPFVGVDQHWLAFIINENVQEAVPHIETQIDWVSDVVIDGWFPGTEYSATLTNADPLRYRRTISQDDARINSNERAAAWARRKLTRRQTPAYWDSIIVDMGHPNAPFGFYDVGDRIYVRGYMPWVGNVSQQHRILAIAVDEAKGSCELTLKAEGAFNYDPIFYAAQTAGSTQVTVQNTPVLQFGADNPQIGTG